MPELRKSELINFETAKSKIQPIPLPLKSLFHFGFRKSFHFRILLSYLVCIFPEIFRFEILFFFFENSFSSANLCVERVYV
ncbi:hypothetical protein A4A49_29243 [Nicotiana attenuata]|uniref:Uncharacterized protein n=1 Tax=Nicotiana attenuata TaxID=49451 RepID=A0A1J6IPZ5_NICAT|nr:hypothetical protein A4A49_29243 [Nicotiana attenuata]